MSLFGLSTILVTTTTTTSTTKQKQTKQQQVPSATQQRFKTKRGTTFIQHETCIIQWNSNIVSKRSQWFVSYSLPEIQHLRLCILSQESLISNSTYQLTRAKLPWMGKQLQFDPGWTNQSSWHHRYMVGWSWRRQSVPALSTGIFCAVAAAAAAGETSVVVAEGNGKMLRWNLRSILTLILLI